MKKLLLSTIAALSLMWATAQTTSQDTLKQKDILTPKKSKFEINKAYAWELFSIWYDLNDIKRETFGATGRIGLWLSYEILKNLHYNTRWFIDIQNTDKPITWNAQWYISRDINKHLSFHVGKEASAIAKHFRLVPLIDGQFETATQANMPWGWLWIRWDYKSWKVNGSLGVVMRDGKPEYSEWLVYNNYKLGSWYRDNMHYWMAIWSDIGKVSLLSTAQKNWNSNEIRQQLIVWISWDRHAYSDQWIELQTWEILRSELWVFTTWDVTIKKSIIHALIGAWYDTANHRIKLYLRTYILPTSK